MINMIRSPVDRIVSLFYYLRKTNRWRKKPSPPKEWFKKDFDFCVKSGDLECQVREKFKHKFSDAYFLSAIQAIPKKLLFLHIYFVLDRWGRPRHAANLFLWLSVSMCE